MRKIIFSFLLVFLGGMSYSVVHAEETNTGKLNVNVEVNTNQANIDWNDIADYYKVYLEGDLIWEGEETKFSHKNLEANHPYNYNIVTYNNDEVDETAEVRTKTLTPNKVLKYDKSIDEETTFLTDGAFIDAVVNTESVKLNLRGEVEDNLDGKLEIYKNGKLLDENNIGTYNDTNVTPGETYVYKFVAKKKIPNDEIQETKRRLEEEGINNLTQEEKEKYFFAPYEYIKVVDVPENKDELVGTSAWNPPVSPASNQVGFKYRTFIPDEFAPATSIADGITKGHKFGGDDRGFSFSGGTHRTQTDVVVRFNDSSSSSFFSKDIADTTLYDKNGKKLGTATPTDVDINMEKGIQKANTNFVRVKHSAQVAYATLPDLTTPNIDYVLGITTHSQDSWSLSGTRDQAPNHELYYYIPYSDVMFDLIQAENEGFEHLLPVFPNATINISM